MSGPERPDSTGIVVVRVASACRIYESTPNSFVRETPRPMSHYSPELESTVGRWTSYRESVAALLQLSAAEACGKKQLGHISRISGYRTRRIRWPRGSYSTNARLVREVQRAPIKDAASMMKRYAHGGCPVFLTLYSGSMSHASVCSSRSRR